MAGGVWKAVDERFYLSSAKGGGMLCREIWVDRRGRVVRYNLASINHLICAVTAVGFESFEQIEARFQKEWNRLAKEVRRA